jgi:hypothetical protein
MLVRIDPLTGIPEAIGPKQRHWTQISSLFSWLGTGQLLPNCSRARMGARPGGP